MITLGILAILFYPSLKLATAKLFSWPKTLAALAPYEGSKSVILTSFPESMPINWYYRGHLPVFNLYLRQDNFNEDERIVRYNWSKQNTSVEELSAWMDKLANSTGAEKIFFVDNAGNYDLLYAAIRKTAWQIRPIELKSQSDFFHVQLYEFIPPSHNPVTFKK
jgi:hypothetical protein